MADLTIRVYEQRIRTVRFQPRPARALYWAYGSNLCHDRMWERCPHAAPVGELEMANFALVFRGVADVSVRRRSRTPGGLWSITRDCEAQLDRYEGVGSRFYLRRFFTATIDGQKHDVLFYQMRMDRGVQPPTEHYVDTIARGYDDFGLDKAYLNQALHEAWDQKEITPILRDRYWQRGRPKLASCLADEDTFTLTEEELRQAGAR